MRNGSWPGPNSIEPCWLSTKLNVAMNNGVSRVCPNFRRRGINIRAPELGLARSTNPKVRNWADKEATPKRHNSLLAQTESECEGAPNL